MYECCVTHQDDDLEAFLPISAFHGDTTDTMWCCEQNQCINKSSFVGFCNIKNHNPSAISGVSLLIRQAELHIFKYLCTPKNVSSFFYPLAAQSNNTMLGEAGITWSKRSNSVDLWLILVSPRLVNKPRG